MSAAVSRRTVPLWRLRVGQSAGRHLVGALAVAGIVASARIALFPPVAPVPAAPAPAHVDPGAWGAALLFARRYLTWDARDPAAHARALAPMLGGNADPDAGLRLPGAGSEHVLWADLAGQRPGGPGEWVYTVAAQTDTAGLLYVTVALRRDAAGALVLARYPALVGGPAVRGAGDLAPPGGEVSDRGLVAVVSRALGNYLAGATDNLAADLSPAARTSPPAAGLTLQRVLAVRWSPGGGAVQATVQADDARGAGLLLTYELDVQRAGQRWLVSAIQTDPTA